MSTSTRPATGRAAGDHRLAVCSWAEVCEEAARLVQDNPVGPLELDMVVVPTAGHRRSLSQAMASRAPGPQITAGLDFVTAAQLVTTVAGRLEACGSLQPDHWRGTSLSLGILQLLSDPGLASTLEPLANHIGEPGARPGRAHAAASRIADLFRRYARQHPEMIEQWRAGRDTGPDHGALAERDLWQPALWRGLRELLGPDPAERREQTRSLAAASRIPGLPQRIVICQVDDPAPADVQFVDALAQHHTVHTITLSGIPRRAAACGSSFLRNHASRAAVLEPLPGPPARTLLARVQHEIRHDLAPEGRHRADHSFQVHACHGPDRQVEVLRDVLCGLFSDDPSLQPRDVVVLCPVLAQYAPLIAASFCLAPDDDLHPGHRLRAQLAAPTLAAVNPVLAVLARIFDLYGGRATSVDLIDLCQSPPVAQRFGFGPEELDRLHELVAAAEIRWGVDADQRRRNGVQVLQSTWLAGVQRLALSLALRDQPPVHLATVTPVPGIGASDAELVGRLAELVSRIRKICQGFDVPASATQWVARLREVIDLLIEVPFGDHWQLSHALAELADLEDQAHARGVLLTAADLEVWLSDRMNASSRRPNYGNGSLLFTTLDDLATVEARVICVLGLDDAVFPGAPGVDGDDLLARGASGRQDHWSDRRRDVRRQRLLDALLAAQESFIVITQGADAATGQPRPAPLCIRELLDACAVEGRNGQWRGAGGPDALVRWHPLHPHGWLDFSITDSERPASFDRQGLSGALALDEGPSPRAPLWRLHHAGEITPVVELDQLVSFFTHPARDLLRRSTGTTRSSFSRELEVALPLDQDPRTNWAVGNALFESLAAGHDPDAARSSVWLGGRVLPGTLGAHVIDEQLDAAARVAAVLRTVRRDDQDLDCDVEVGDSRVQGRVGLHGGRVVVSRFGHIKPDDAVACWVRLVLLSAAHKDPSPALEGLLIGKRCFKLAAPAPALARRLLGDMITLRADGLRQVLPLPIRTAAAHADVLCFDSGEPLARARQAYRSEDDNWSYFFSTFDDLTEPGPKPSDPLPENSTGDEATSGSRFERLASWLFGPIATRLSRWQPERGQH